MKISFFDNVKNTTPSKSMTLEQYVMGISFGIWKDVVSKIRSASAEDYSAQKALAPLVTISGEFTSRKKDGLIQHSGLIAMDIDEKENDVNKINKFVASPSPEACVVHRSIGGEGIVIIYKINPDDHLKSFYAISENLAEVHGLIADKACKDVSRARFVSFDSDVYHNADAPIWDKFPEVKEDKRKTREYRKHSPNLDNTMRIAKELAVANPTLLDDYADWMTIGFSLISEHGEEGREAFHVLSEVSSKYDAKDTDEKYSQLLSDYDGHSITIGSFYMLAKENNVEIIKIDKVDREQTMSRAEADKYIVDYMANNKPDEKTIYDLMCVYVNSYGIRYNELSQRPDDLNGEDLRDSFEAIALYHFREITGLATKAKMGHMREIVDAATRRSYNPVIDELNRLANVPRHGVIDTLLDCLIPDMEAETDIEMKRKMVRKWLVSIVASPMGERCELCLVLVGNQGNGKTTFFLNLLPPSLKKYLKFGDFSSDKDSKLALSQNMLLVNDEMTNMHRADWKQFKALVSMETIDERVAYGRRSEKKKRVAVFGGATNDDEFLSDLSGNRRIIPYNLERLDFDTYMGIDKEALFSELMHEYLSDKENSWKLTADERHVLNIVSESNEFKFNDQLLIKEVFGRPQLGEDCYRISATDALRVLKYMDSSFTGVQATLIGKTLKKLGFTKVKSNGSVYYFVSDKAGVLAEIPASIGISLKRARRTK